MKSLFGFAVLFFSFDKKNNKKKLEFFSTVLTQSCCVIFIVMENFRGTKVDIMQNLDELIFR